MLLGRADEVEAVSRLLAAARLGQGGALAVVGEPGAGKTALLTEALAGIDGHAQVLWATGTEIEHDLPFAALHAVLRPGLRLLDQLPGRQAAALAGALSLREDGAGDGSAGEDSPGEASPGDRFATGAATLSLLSLLAEEHPVIVVLDDAHWADQPSVEALAFAARRLHEDPVAILCGARSGEVPEALRSVPVLEVGGLDAASGAELLRRSRPAAADPVTAERLQRVTGGNPLALLELGAQPDLVLVDPVAGGEAGLLQLLPERLRAAFARRLDLLTDGQRALALVAVVAGGDLRLTRAVYRRLDLDGDDQDRVIATGLMGLDGARLVFPHPLLRSVSYRTAPEELRRAAHLAVAEELTAEDERDLRVWHRAAAATHLDEGLALELEAVGARAVARSALAVASTAYERAARWSPDGLAARGRLVAAAQAAWDGGEGDRALALLAETESAGATVTAAAAQLRAVIAVRTGSIREGLTQLEEAAEHAPVDERVLLLAQAVHACLYLVDARAVRRVTGRLSECLAEVESPAAHAVGLAALGVARVLLGEDGTPQLREAEPLLSDHVDPLAQSAALPWLMLAPLFLREAREGAELRGVVDEARTRIGVGALPNLLFHVARDQATSSAYERAAANFDEAVRLARETGQGTELTMALAGLASLESRTGQAGECREHAAEALALARARDIHFGEICCELALGDLALSEGDPRAAAEHLIDLVARLGDLGVGDADLDPGPELVDALLRVGEVAEATRAARRFASLAGPTARPWTRARVERALLLVASDEECEVHFRAALAQHALTRDVFEAARTRLSFGMRLRRAGRRVDARPVLREALTAFDGLGARLWAEATRAELEATGEKVAPRDPLGPGSLTPQELQVCLLLAEGRTTREAAAALFLSPKTIEYHLRKAYTKLGIHSREELAALLQEMH